MLASTKTATNNIKSTVSSGNIFHLPEYQYWRLKNGTVPFQLISLLLSTTQHYCVLPRGSANHHLKWGSYHWAAAFPGSVLAENHLESYKSLSCQCQSPSSVLTCRWQSSGKFCPGWNKLEFCSRTQWSKAEKKKSFLKLPKGMSFNMKK